MGDRDKSNLGKKQLLLSQVRVHIKKKKVRTEVKANEIVSIDYTFELGVTKQDTE